MLTHDLRLPGPASQRIVGADRAALSVISLYEIGQKVRLGKWSAMEPFASGLVERADRDGFDLLPLSPSAALDASLLEWERRDPVGRMIAVVARQEGLVLISADTAFDALIFQGSGTDAADDQRTKGLDGGGWDIHARWPR